MSQSLRLLRKLAERGNAQAQYDLAMRYLEGKDVDKDATMAVGWLRKAAEAKHTKASLELGHCLREGDGVAPDAAAAVESYTRGAELGDAECMTALGVAFHKGVGTAQDVSAAVHWLQRAVDAGDVPALSQLGLCYQKGDGVHLDQRRAFELFLRGAEQGEPEAQYSLAGCYYRGVAVPKDKSIAMRWLRRSAAQGNEMAKTQLAGYGGSVRGGEDDPVAKATVILGCAEQGDAGAMYDLARRLRAGEPAVEGLVAREGHGETAEQQGMRWLLRAVQHGDRRAQDDLATQCWDGGDAVPQDRERALQLWRLSAEQGWAPAAMALGERLARGEGVEADYAQAERWLGLAVREGLGPAIPLLADLLLTKKGRPTEAGRLLSWAIESNVKGALERLGAADVAREPAIVAHVCTGCGRGKTSRARVTLRACSRCGVARFCGPECLRRMWPSHKASCAHWVKNPPVAEAEADGDGAAEADGEVPLGAVQRISVIRSNRS